MQSTLDGKVPVVVIDTHEVKVSGNNASKILASLLDKENIEYRVDTLPIGDIVMPRGVIIERKTFSDFINSLKGDMTGVLRLENQIKSMIETYSTPILLIEDALAIRKDPLNKCIYMPIRRYQKGKNIYVTIERKIKFNPKYYDSLLQKFKKMGISIIETFDSWHAAIVLLNILKSLIGKENTEEETISFSNNEPAVPIIRGKPKLMETPDEQEFFLAGLPLINIKRARLILNKFKNPINALNNIDSWEKIPTIGKRIVREVKKVLYTEYKRCDVNHGREE